MAIRTISVNRLHVVADLFGSFHEAQDACSRLKAKNFPEESVLQFVELTGHDDIGARESMFKDLGYKARQIEFLDKALKEGKILVCVDALKEESCDRVEELLRLAGGLECENSSNRAKPAAAVKRPLRSKKSASTKTRISVDVKLPD